MQELHHDAYVLFSSFWATYLFLFNVHPEVAQEILICCNSFRKVKVLYEWHSESLSCTQSMLLLVQRPAVVTEKYSGALFLCVLRGERRINGLSFLLPCEGEKNYS